MNTPQIPPSTGRNIIQGQPVSVFHFGSSITPPYEPGYSMQPGSVLSSVTPKPPAIGIAGVSSPTFGQHIFNPPPPGAIGVPYNGQGNGVPTGVTGGGGDLAPVPVTGGVYSSQQPARAIGVGYIPPSNNPPVQQGGPIARVFTALFG